MEPANQQDVEEVTDEDIKLVRLNQQLLQYRSSRLPKTLLPYS